MQHASQPVPADAFPSRILRYLPSGHVRHITMGLDRAYYPHSTATKMSNYKNNQGYNKTVTKMERFKKFNKLNRVRNMHEEA